MIPLLLIPLLYCIFIFMLYAGWKKAPFYPLWKEQKKIQEISLIIAARNEENNLPALFQAVSQLKYPAEKLELVLVDDHSKDETFNLAQQLMQKLNINGKVITSSGNGKKQAIADGISKASHPFIVTTDADCTFHPEWLLIINQYYQETSSQMLLMPVVYTGNFFLAKLQHVEALALAGTTAGSLLSGFPLLSNGAAMAFEKQVYDHCSKKDLRFDLVSGDDTFLMLNYHHQPFSKINFIRHSSAIVFSAAQDAISGLMQQRIRWASKTKKYSQRYIQLTGLLILTYALLIIASIVVFLIHPVIGNLWLWSFLLIKLLADYTFVCKTASDLKQPFYKSAFMAWQLLYPFYIVVTGILSVAGVYKWKGRKYNS